MKTKSILAALLLIVAGVQTARAQKMTVNLIGGEAVEYDVTMVESVTFDEEPIIIDGHEYVNLGLPSGTLWATCNVGANSPEEYGDYFAWGETQPKDMYNWASYQWMVEGQGDWTHINKYTFADNQKSGCWYDGDTFIGDGKKELLPADDAATANWGSNWQMPSRDQCEELMNEANTTTEWTTQGGVSGLKVTSKKNGKSIFLPAVGSKSAGYVGEAGVKGQYWSRMLYTNFSDYGFSMLVSASSFSMTGINRSDGHAVRPVRAKQQVVTPHDYVEIGGTKWATMNVGATTVAGSHETCYGDYFAWGETEPRYESISWSSAESATITWKNSFRNGYSPDNYSGYTTMDDAHDAATANWGKDWRTPTSEEFDALAAACSDNGFNDAQGLMGKVTTGGIYCLNEAQTYEPEYTGVRGVLFVSKSDITKRVFFPTAGYLTSRFEVVGGNGFRGAIYRSSTLTSDTQQTYSLYFMISEFSFLTPYQIVTSGCYGCPVRPVKK